MGSVVTPQFCRPLTLRACVLALLCAFACSEARAATCRIEATTAPYVCPARDAGPQPDEFPVFRVENPPTNRSMVYGSRFTQQRPNESFGIFEHRVGKRVFNCVTPVPTPAVQCPVPTWNGQFALSASVENTKTLVAIWSDSAAAWATTRVYVPAANDGVGAQITVSATPPAGYPAGVTPAAIPGGSSFGGYFLLDVPTGANRSGAFTYRSALPSRISWRVYARIATSVRIGDVNENRGILQTGTDNGASGSTMFKPLIGVTSAPTAGIAGGCIGPITISTQDGNGAVIDTTTANRVSLVPHATPGFIYLDPACAYPTETTGIQNPVPAAPPGQRPPTITSTRQSQVYFKINNSYAAFPLSVDYRDTDGALIYSTVQNQVVTAGAPVAFRVTAPGSVAQGECSSAIRIAFVDKFGNEAAFPSARQISIGGAQFFGQPGCSSDAVNSFPVAGGVSAVELYMRTDVAGIARVLVGSSGLQSATADVRVLSNGLLARAGDLPSAQNMARRLYRRLAGVPLLNDSVLNEMANLLLTGKAMQAARIATTQAGFYNVTLKQFFTKMSNRLEDPSETLSDFVTTGIGIVRDNRDAREFLTGKTIYVGQAYRTTDANACANSVVYKSNQHFAQMESSRADLSTQLTPVRQCVYNNTQFTSDSPIPSDDTAGLATTHKWGEQHLFAGTNRRAFEFMLKQFNCLSITQMSDSTNPDWHIRRDVDRAPGNDPRTYTNSCRACHGFLDMAAGAFAFHDWYERPNNGNGPEDSRIFLVRGGYGGEAAMPKMNINALTFPAGWITSDNSWSLPLSQKQQALLRIDEGIATSGNGVNALGRTLANSGSFRGCMAQRAFELVCLRAPAESDASSVSDLATYLADTGYNMRAVIERAAVLGPCLGGGDAQ